MADYKRTSELMVELSKNITSPSVSVSMFLSVFGKNGLVICVLAFALPNIVPIGLPVISSISGLLIMIVSAQIALGRTSIYLPKTLGNKQLSSDKIKKIIEFSLPILNFIERFAKPRLYNSSIFSKKLIALYNFFLGFILFLPIPFVNFIIAFFICILSIGLLQKDGLLMSIGIVFSFVIMAVNYKLILVIVDLV
jgi:hypothetical protein